MDEFISLNPILKVNEEEYKRLLGYPPDYIFEGRAAELAEWARDWYNKNGNPWIYGIPVENISSLDGKIYLSGQELNSTQLQHQFSEASVESAVVVAVSAGKECEEKAHELWLREKPDEYFFLEIFGSAVVEHLVALAGFSLCGWAEKNNLAVLPHYSPGYTGWNINDQNQLWKIISRKKTKNFPGQLEILGTGMLKPKKSMLALFGITREVSKESKELIPCEACSMQSCKYRRVPYKHSRNQVENLRIFQREASLDNLKYTLDPEANYSVNRKALEKWSQQRLKLNILDDSSVEAKFTYEGTTCSNMGHLLKFDYLIRTGSASEGYPITSLECKPSQDDDGYTFMCEYIADAENLMVNIEKEKPLLGRPLNDVLEWKHEFSPEGCFCKIESRKHKWGLVFEVLHYALNELRKNKNNQI